jgi:hypothetical protein
MFDIYINNIKKEIEKLTLATNHQKESKHVEGSGNDHLHRELLKTYIIFNKSYIFITREQIVGLIIITFHTASKGSAAHFCSSFPKTLANSHQNSDQNSAKKWLS